MSDKHLDQNIDTEGTNDGMLQNGDIESKTSENGKHSSYQSFKRRLRNDKIFKKKFIIFLCLCYSFLILVSTPQASLFLHTLFIIRFYQ